MAAFSSWLDDENADGAGRAIAGGANKSAFLAAKAGGVVVSAALLPYFLAKKLCKA